MARIVRDGKVYELTRTEAYDAYREIEKELLIEDIRIRAEENEISLANVDIEDVVHNAQRSLDHNDCYWECYWQSVEHALDQIKGVE